MIRNYLLNIIDEELPSNSDPVQELLKNLDELARLSLKKSILNILSCTNNLQINKFI